MQAYAYCAPKPLGWHIVEATASAVTSTVLSTFASCPDGQVAIGSGAAVSFGTGGTAYLQVARPSGSGDIVRAQGHKAPGAAEGFWAVIGYAVCINTLPGYHVQFAGSKEQTSEPEKSAIAYCPDGTRVHGAGGAVADFSPANIALRAVVPGEVSSARATAHETVPTDENWNVAVATAICAF